MVTKTINAMNRCKKCIDSRKSFVLQGGAGICNPYMMKVLMILTFS